MAGFRDLKVGDRVNRMIGDDKFWMEMEVVSLTDDLIECGAVHKNGTNESIAKFGWTFDRDLGCEEDHELQWGKKFGRTGSYLKLKENEVK